MFKKKKKKWSQTAKKGLFLRGKNKKNFNIYIYICRESPCPHCLAPTTIQSIPPHPSHYFCEQIPDNITFYPQIFQYVFFYFLLFIYLFLAVLGLHYCTCFSSSCGEWGLLFVAQPTHYGGSSCYGARALGRAGMRGFSGCGPQAAEHRLTSCGARA